MIHFDADPVLKRTRTFHVTDEDEFVVASEHDVTDIVEFNRAARAASKRRAKWGEMTWVGQIPNAIFWDLWQKGIAQDDEALKKWLMDPDNSAFLVRDGRL